MLTRKKNGGMFCYYLRSQKTQQLYSGIYVCIVDIMVMVGTITPNSPVS